MLAALAEQHPAVIFLAYPNNPTGQSVSMPSSCARSLSRADGLVVIDEAYAPFTDASFMSDIGEYDNLLVLRTVSKMGLAGLRLGLLAGPPAWLEQIDKTRLPYNISVINQLTGYFALAHRDTFAAQAREIRGQRATLIRACRVATVNGVSERGQLYPVSYAPGLGNRACSRASEAGGILIKNLDGHPDPCRTVCVLPLVCRRKMRPSWCTAGAFAIG